MNTTLYTIIVVVSCLSDMVADLFLSAVLGLISIAFWLCPLLVLQKLSGVLGGIANVIFAMYSGRLTTTLK